MDEEKWTDEDVEKLFKDVPEIQDKRSKNEILNRLKSDERITQKPVPSYKRKKVRIPALMTAAVLLILSLVVPLMLNASKSEESMDTSSEAEDTNAESAVSESASLIEEQNTKFGTKEVNDQLEEMETDEHAFSFESYLLLPEQIGNNHVMQISVEHNSMVLPVTYLISKSRIIDDFDTPEPNNIDLYNKYVEKFHGNDESQIRSEVNHAIPVESFKFSLEKTFQPYYKYVSPSGEAYLIPAGKVKGLNVTEALEQMKKEPNHLVETLIPEGVNYKVDSEVDYEVITFQEPFNIIEMNGQKAIEMIEGFILTAHNYNRKVKLENIIQNEFDKYDLTRILPEPIAINPIILH